MAVKRRWIRRVVCLDKCRRRDAYTVGSRQSVRIVVEGASVNIRECEVYARIAEVAVCVSTRDRELYVRSAEEVRYAFISV
jgi:hypothetical protein